MSAREHTHVQVLTSGRNVARRRGTRLPGLLVFVVLTVAMASDMLAAAQGPVPEPFPGLSTFVRIDANIAIGGSLSFDALPELKRRGFKAVIDLRRPSERDANVEAEGMAVRAAGLKYINLPFSATDPFDVAALQVEPFFKAVADPANLPALIHSGETPHRPVGMLLMKEVLIDGWTVEQGLAPAYTHAFATDQGAGTKLLRDFVFGYIKAHAR